MWGQNSMNFNDIQRLLGVLGYLGSGTFSFLGTSLIILPGLDQKNMVKIMFFYCFLNHKNR